MSNIGTSVGKTKVVKITGAELGATATTYADGDVIGNKIFIENIMLLFPGQATLMSITAQDLDSQNSALEVILWGSDPTGTTFTDDAALDIADADLPKHCGSANVAATDYKSYTDNSVGTVRNIGLPIGTDTENDLWMTLVSRGTPTYTANGLSLILTFYLDQ
tara:strand:- start:2661 stop:3149 length:489 start_codon:yes stop_codon:yes gene_type:complete